MGQQMTSLQYLWKAVKPSGMHVCDDIRPGSHLESAGGDRGILGRMTE